MAITVAVAKAVVELDDRPFEEGLDRADRHFQEWTRGLEQKGDAAARRISAALGKIDTSALNDIGGKMSLAFTAPMLAAAGASVRLASDANESLSKVNVVFGQNSAAIEAWSKDAVAKMGMTSQEAQEAAGTFGNLFVAMKLGPQAASDMSRSLVQLAADLGSFNNVSTEDALLALRAGLVGEVEPLRRFGVNLSAVSIEAKATAMGLAGTGKELSAAAKAQAAYALILEQTTTAQGDFVRTGDGVANSTKKVIAGLKDTAAAIGKDLLPIAKAGLDSVRFLANAFSSMPKDLRNVVTGLLLTAAAVGPVTLAFTGLVKTWESLVKAKTSLSAAWTAVTGGAAASTAATTAETAATAANTVTTAEATAARTTYSSAVSTSTVSLGANTTSTIANTAALAENAVAGQAAGGAGGGLAGRIGLGAPMFGGGLGANLLLGAGVGYAGWQAATFASEMQDRRRGVSTPGDWWQHLNPFRTGRDDAAQENATAEAAAADVRDRWKTENGGLSPRQAMLKAQADARAAGRAETHSYTDAQFSAELEGAKSAAEAGPEATRAREEANRAIPIIQKRVETLKTEAEALKPLINRSAKDAEDYWKNVKEQASLAGDAEKLKQAAAKEVVEQAKKAKDAATHHRDQVRDETKASFEAAQAEVRAIVANAPEQLRAATEAREMIPELVNRQKVLVQEVQSLGLKGKDYGQAAAEYWALQADVNQLQRAATKETAENQKKAVAEQRAGMDAYFDARMQMAEAASKEAAEGYEARGKANELIRVIDDKQQALTNLARTQKGKEYWETTKEYWKLEAQAQELQNAADREVKEQTKKALEAAKKARADQREINSARLGLAQAQLANNPFLNDRQKKGALVPLMVEQFKSLMQASPDETKIERLRRLTEAEGLKGDITSAALGGRRNPYGAAQILGRLGLIGQEAARTPALPRDGSRVGVDLTIRSYPPEWRDLFSDPSFQRALGDFIEFWRADRRAATGATLVPRLP